MNGGPRGELERREELPSVTADLFSALEGFRERLSIVARTREEPKLPSTIDRLKSQYEALTSKGPNLLSWDTLMAALPSQDHFLAEMETLQDPQILEINNQGQLVVVPRRFQRNRGVEIKEESLLEVNKGREYTFHRGKNYDDLAREGNYITCIDQEGNIVAFNTPEDVPEGWQVVSERSFMAFSDFRDIRRQPWFDKHSPVTAWLNNDGNTPLSKFPKLPDLYDKFFGPDFTAEEPITIDDPSLLVLSMQGKIFFALGDKSMGNIGTWPVLRFTLNLSN